jgi:hypothetical protein
LARELGDWINAIEVGPQIRGGVGARNEHAIASRPKAKSVARRQAKLKPKARRNKSTKKKAKRRS